jgi:hypothetical protein
MTIKIGGSKAGGTVRGGGGICPAKGHAKFFDVNLGEAQDLARVAEGKVRTLTKIPEFSRLEATGLRVQGLIGFAGPGAKGGRSNGAAQLRASVGVVEVGKNSPLVHPHRPAELEKRTKAEWDGLHIRVNDGQQLWVQLQSQRSEDATAPWNTVFEITIDPLKAFTVEDLDVVWYPTKLVMGNSHVTVWVELSLMKLTSAIMDRVKTNLLVMKQRNKVQRKFAHKR